MPEKYFKKFTLQRIGSFISQIKLLREIDFPYEDSRGALDIILNHFEEQRRSVAECPIEQSAGLMTRCSVSTKQIFRYHRFLGYISKSADPANAYEIYFSFRRLAGIILGSDVRLVMSSEWENYSPVNFTIPEFLRNHVFIGLPVSEAGNALIVPLAGHELGHSIWSQLNYEGKYLKEVREKMHKLLSGDDYSDDELLFYTHVSILKAAEYFCDFIGLGIFGNSFLYSFTYLAAPFVSEKVGRTHPNGRNRSKALKKAAHIFDLEMPFDPSLLYKNQGSPLKSHDEPLQKAEEVAFKMVPKIARDVKSLLIDRGVLYIQSKDHRAIVDEFLECIPSSLSKSLADITNAAWEVNLIGDKWSNFDLSDQEKSELLNELTIKSFEILEINQRLNNDS